MDNKSIIIQIQQRLQFLHPISIEIDDESRHHRGHAGAMHGGHFKLTVVADCFKGQNMLARHRTVYQALGDLMKTSIHALAIYAFTAEEALFQTTRKGTE